MQIDPLRRIASRDRGRGGRNVEKLPLFPNSLQFVAKKLRFNQSHHQKRDPIEAETQLKRNLKHNATVA